MGFLVVLRIIVIISIAHAGNHVVFAKSAVIEEPKKAVVLVIHMFKEPYQETNSLRPENLVNNFKAAFRDKGIDVTMLVASANKNIKDPYKRIREPFEQIEKVLLKSPSDMRITHIIFAGNSVSKDTQLLIGDMLFCQETIDTMTARFKTLRTFLHPKLKVFLFGPATFSGTKEQILTKAEWFGLALGAKEIEIFGYDGEIATDTARLFFKDDPKVWLILYAIAAFLGGALVFLEGGSWRGVAALEIFVSMVFGAAYVYSNYLMYTRVIAFFRRLFDSSNSGTVVHLSRDMGADSHRYSTKRFSAVLGHDYFINEYVLYCQEEPQEEMIPIEYLATTFIASILLGILWCSRKRTQGLPPGNGPVLPQTLPQVAASVQALKTLIRQLQITLALPQPPENLALQRLEDQVIYKCLYDGIKTLREDALAKAVSFTEAFEHFEPSKILDLFSQYSRQFLKIFVEQARLLDDVGIDGRQRHLIIQRLRQEYMDLLEKIFIKPLFLYYGNIEDEDPVEIPRTA